MSNTKRPNTGDKRLDGYLSRKAQLVYPTALVYCGNRGPVEVWTLERAGEEIIGLGDSFNAAHQAVVALVTAERMRKAAGR